MGVFHFQQMQKMSILLWGSFFSLLPSPCKCMHAKNKEAVFKFSISFVNLTSVRCHSTFHRDAEATCRLSTAQSSALLKGGGSELLMYHRGGISDPWLSPSHRPAASDEIKYETMFAPAKQESRHSLWSHQRSHWEPIRIYETSLEKAWQLKLKPFCC